MDTKICGNCQHENNGDRYFCEECGALLIKQKFSNPQIYETTELKVMRIVDNLRNNTPHTPVVWHDTIDRYAKTVERVRALLALPGMEHYTQLCDKMDKFIDFCQKPEFQIAFVGTIKTGKSTLINALLGRNYASMDVTPETAALTKFRFSPIDYINITFYSHQEWEALMKPLQESKSFRSETFMKEYKKLKAEREKDKWLGHKPLHKEIPNNDLIKELHTWSTSKRAEHYFVKEIEVGISTLPNSFPNDVVFVDTPGLSDPVAYRSEITKRYIRKANAILVCVDAQRMNKEEIDTISTVFSISSHNKEKVHIIATHWDTLNHPEEDWKKQKKHMVGQLTGKGFFDTPEFAEANILYSAAYIYNLCQDIDKLSLDDIFTSLGPFALKMRCVDLRDRKGMKQKLTEASNIDNIRRTIEDRLLKKYRELLSEDMKKTYIDIVQNVKRIAEDDRKAMRELIDVSSKDIAQLEARVERLGQERQEIQNNSKQLQAALRAVQTSTDQRLQTILSKLTV